MFNKKRKQTFLRKILASIQQILDIVEKFLSILDKIKSYLPTIPDLRKIAISLMIAYLHQNNNS